MKNFLPLTNGRYIFCATFRLAYFTHYYPLGCANDSSWGFFIWLQDLAEQVGITIQNLSILKNGRAKAGEKYHSH